MTTSEDTTALQNAVASSRRSGVGKLLASPWRMGRSKLIELSCRRNATTSEQVARTFWGEPFNVIFPERVGMTIYRYGFFEEELSHIFISHLKPGMTFYDVGSHFGFFSLLAAHLVGPTGKVHAFDPTPSTFKMLTKNLGGRPNVRLNNVAGFNQNAELEFNDFGIEHSAFNSLFGGKIEAGDGPAARPNRVKVRAVTIDSYVEQCGEPPNFLKIDAEGAELAILEGMENTLRKHRPTLTLEMGDIAGSENQTPSRAVVDHILSRGYQGWEWHEGRLTEHKPVERYTYSNILFTPR